ncbi:MAG: Putative lipoprotein/NMB1162 [Candidatus Celerinatantimonas neptuna]|nr:MAG: Putative lipoprotein/NMB1162 [Candidatus Celerinatantimonas neptuna]
MTIKRFLILLGLVALLGLTGCATKTTPYNYDALIKAKPRSILIMPPLNDSIAVNASYIEMSTLSRPLGEKGYYVFPVAVIDNFMKQNGLPTPAEMNKVPLEKLYENIGADAVLYTRIEDWGQKYMVLNSETVVKLDMKLVDCRTGALLWNSSVTAVDDSGNSSGGGLLGALISAAANQIAGSISDRTPAVARKADYTAIYNKSRGLLNGPYAPSTASAK